MASSNNREFILAIILMSARRMWSAILTLFSACRFALTRCHCNRPRPTMRPKDISGATKPTGNSTCHAPSRSTRRAYLRQLPKVNGTRDCLRVGTPMATEPKPGKPGTWRGRAGRCSRARPGTSQPERAVTTRLCRRSPIGFLSSLWCRPPMRGISSRRLRKGTRCCRCLSCRPLCGPSLPRRQTILRRRCLLL